MVLDKKYLPIALVAGAALAGLYYVKMKDTKTEVGPKVQNPWDVSYFPKKINMLGRDRTKHYAKNLDYCWSDAQNADSGISMIYRGDGYSGRNPIY